MKYWTKWTLRQHVIINFQVEQEKWVSYNLRGKCAGRKLSKADKWFWFRRNGKNYWQVLGLVSKYLTLDWGNTFSCMKIHNSAWECCTLWGVFISCSFKVFIPCFPRVFIPCSLWGVYSLLFSRGVYSVLSVCLFPVLSVCLFPVLSGVFIPCCFKVFIPCSPRVFIPCFLKVFIPCFPSGNALLWPCSCRNDPLSHHLDSRAIILDLM